MRLTPAACSVCGMFIVMPRVSVLNQAAQFTCHSAGCCDAELRDSAFYPLSCYCCPLHAGLHWSLLLQSNVCLPAADLPHESARHA